MEVRMTSLAIRAGLCLLFGVARLLATAEPVRTTRLAATACSWGGEKKVSLYLVQHEYDLHYVQSSSSYRLPIVLAVEATSDAIPPQKRLWQLYTTSLQSAVPTTIHLGAMACGGKVDQVWLALVAVQGYWVRIYLYEVNQARAVTEILPTAKMMQENPIAIDNQAAPFAAIYLDVGRSACFPDRVEASRDGQKLEISLASKTPDCQPEKIVLDLVTKKFGPIPAGWTLTGQ